MSRYIDADVLKNKITELDGGCAINGTGFDIYTCEVFQLIDEVPAADVVEVIRCEHCRHWDDKIENGVYVGNLYHRCEYDGEHKDPRDFCSYAARRIL